MKIRCLDLNRVMGLLYHVHPASLKGYSEVQKFTSLQFSLIAMRFPFISKYQSQHMSGVATLSGGCVQKFDKEEDIRAALAYGAEMSRERYVDFVAEAAG